MKFQHSPLSFVLTRFDCTVNNLSKRNTLEIKENVLFREVSRLERFYMYSKYREQDLKTNPV